jgi:hypothetical protein
VVFYTKYAGSTWVDPHDEDRIAFRDLPNRFPSVLSRDFRREQGEYEDEDNLFAMYLLYNLGRYSVRVNERTRLLEIDRSKDPMPYAEAAKLAGQSARSDSGNYGRRAAFEPQGRRIGQAAGDSGR